MSTVARLVDSALETTVVGSWTRVGPSIRRLVGDWQPLSTFDLRGRTVLVTGGNGGLGAAIASQLAQLGATVHVTVRDDEKGRLTLDEIRTATGNDAPPPPGFLRSGARSHRPWPGQAPCPSRAPWW